MYSKQNYYSSPTLTNNSLILYYQFSLICDKMFGFISRLAFFMLYEGFIITFINNKMCLVIYFSFLLPGWKIFHKILFVFY